MKLIFRKLYILALSTLIMTFFQSCSTELKKEGNLKIWYKQPTKVIENEKQNNESEWLKALPLGNGSLGLMVFGDVNRERIAK